MKSTCQVIHHLVVAVLLVPHWMPASSGSRLFASGIPTTSEQLIQRFDEARKPYQSVEIIAEETTIETTPPELQDPQSRNLTKSKDEKGKPLSTEAGPVVGTRKWLMLVSHGKVRYETGDVTGEKVDATGQISTFDGQESRYFAPGTREVAGKIMCHGFIWDKNYASSDQVVQLSPLRWRFRGIGFLGTGNYDPRLLVLQKDQGVFDGETCLIAEYECASIGTYTFWFAPRLDYAIVRMTFYVSGDQRSQMDCHYAQTESGLWLPASWTNISLSGGKIRRTIETKVVKSIVNPKLDDNLFRVEFPVGCVVSDQRPGQPRGRTGTYDYIVKANGEKRRILWKERNATYSELLNTKSGEAGPTAADYRPPQLSWVSILMISVNALAGIALAAYLCRRFFGAPTPAKPEE
ncbi:MAG: hypothetical protein U0903_03685 [Planctomycetales bacterium]